MMTTMTKARLSFLSLPAEIRIMIYNLVLRRDLPIELGLFVGPDKWWKDALLVPGWALFYVNKQVSTEARHQFYSINTFAFGETVIPPDEEFYRESDYHGWIQNIGGNALSIRNIDYFLSAAVDQDTVTLPLLVQLGRLMPNVESLVLSYRLLRQDHCLIAIFIRLTPQSRIELTILSLSWQYTPNLKGLTIVCATNSLAEKGAETRKRDALVLHDQVREVLQTRIFRRLEAVDFFPS
ncbi:hypothetical protein VTJ49DRAFT_502 [Mycothermus thermophilus]|uniref:F-box domain-containing protein n=1 Tax=Humicola insolens TaxID=85995 RepID=A0ABR3VEZ4_HUMIN